MSKQRLLLITGKLAEPSLRQLVDHFGPDSGFECHIHVAKISVAALMTTDWLAKQLPSLGEFDRVILPGLVRGDLEVLASRLGSATIERGPKDLRDLHRYLKGQGQAPVTYGEHRLEIIAEINHANRLSMSRLGEVAARLVRDGADRIDLGATPSEPWEHLAEAVQQLTQSGYRVSIDSFDANEVTRATAAGASLVLSVNRSNMEQAVDWGAEVVVIPDHHERPGWLENLEEIASYLDARRVPFRLDPILDPIGFGFAHALERYVLTRRRFPDVPIMMGIGNVTELTAVDSAGVNAVLAGFCAELGIESVLTTQVIPWAQHAVAELAIARQLMHYAATQQAIPKYVDERLVVLADPSLPSFNRSEVKQIQRQLTDANFRIFADPTAGKIYVFNRDLFLEADPRDPGSVFEQLGVTDASHAFYLGWELMKASTAVVLGKHYIQDRALTWGHLTQDEISHHNKKHRAHRSEAPR